MTAETAMVGCPGAGVKPGWPAEWTTMYTSAGRSGFATAPGHPTMAVAAIIGNFFPEILPALIKAARYRYYPGNTAFSLYTQTQSKFLIE